MNTQTLSRRRNLGIIAHIDAGKTTLTERLLWKSGEIHRVGEVHDGNATTDFSAIERERGITIGAAAVQAQWAPRDLPPHRLTLIDTPATSTSPLKSSARCACLMVPWPCSRPWMACNRSPRPCGARRVATACR